MLGKEMLMVGGERKIGTLTIDIERRCDVQLILTTGAKDLYGPHVEKVPCNEVLYVSIGRGYGVEESNLSYQREYWYVVDPYKDAYLRVIPAGSSL